MRRTWTLGALFTLGVTACSGGAYPVGHYTGGQPYGGEDDGSSSEDGDTGIDLDGGGPPPPPPGENPPPPGGHGECCAEHDTPGCNNKPVEQCVCAKDSWCCESEWDDACTMLIEELGCGHCTDGGGEPPPPPGDSGEPPPAGEESGGEPPPPPDDGGEPPPDDGGEPPPPDDGGEPPPDDSGEPPPAAGDCCTDNGEVSGCVDAAVQDCVCAEDPYCCDTAWDEICVDEVDSLACGTCGGGGDGGGEGDSACCEQQEGAGCPDATVETCVCAVDPYCCNVFWDLTCVGEVELHSCGSCS
jgi:hypothetical protein